MIKWTRERIIREILQREAADLPLVPSGEQGVDSSLYQAGTRVFGTWRNAVQAAGISPERARLREYWTPSRVVSTIQYYGRMKRPPRDFRRKHGSLFTAAQRYFGSWLKALAAAGVEPNRFQRIVRWTETSVIEGILKRALANEPLGSQSVQPRSLSVAGTKFFGSWSAAIAKAGLDPARLRQGATKEVRSTPTRIDGASTKAARRKPRVGRHGSGRSWTNEQVIEAVLARFHNHQKLGCKEVYRDDCPLHRAAVRRYGTWRNTLHSAGLNPDEVGCRRGRPRKFVDLASAVAPACDTVGVLRPNGPAEDVVLTSG